ncbi:MAG: hypothetical protein JXR96_07975 [Deltaproteobacteria bacterium]|nr:hypothetical protein [Deltaproteobacteria bacterium]
MGKEPAHDPQTPSSRAREPYEPPRISFVELAVDEALMGICKGGLGAGPLGPGCSGGPSGCMGGGS